MYWLRARGSRRKTREDNFDRLRVRKAATDVVGLGEHTFDIRRRLLVEVQDPCRPLHELRLVLAVGQKKKAHMGTLFVDGSVRASLRANRR